MKGRHFVASLFLLSLGVALAFPAAGAALQAPPHPGSFSPSPPGAEDLRPAAPQATGGPDDYGYTWDDATAYAWLEGTIDTGLSDNCEDLAAVPIGFGFPFYEKSYSTAYVSYNGWLTFAAGDGCEAPEQIPDPSMPNDLIAAYAIWARGGTVRYAQGGTAPNRTLVVEWEAMRDACSGTNFTFEVVLHENGEIVLQYQAMAYAQGCWRCGYTGIEDSTGTDGLLYQGCQELDGSSAVTFFRPPPSARVRLWPHHQGIFAAPGSSAAFEVPVRNTGNLGTDTFDLSASSAWPVSFLAADGVTPLTDTDADGVVDTGPVAQGAIVPVVARVSVPAAAGAGDYDAPVVMAHSSLNPAKEGAATLQAAVPAPFAQAYIDNDDRLLSLKLVQPVAQVVRKAGRSYTTADHPAVAETPGGMAYVWVEYESYGNYDTYEIWYQLYDRYGQPLRPAARLTDHSAAAMHIYDQRPAVAATPDGRIGVLWYRYQRVYGSGEGNCNVWFAVVNSTGDLVYGPANVTNNAAWGDSGDIGWPTFVDPALAATGDNRFVLAWSEFHLEPPGGGCTSDCRVHDIYYAVRSGGGEAVKPVTQLTFDTPGDEEAYTFPNLASLSGARALLSWTQASTEDIQYAVLDGAGNLVKDKANLVGDGDAVSDWASDAVQLSGGRALVAWVSGDYPDYQIRYALLDGAYNRVFGPATLDNPSAPAGNTLVSAAADGADHAILTWTDEGWEQRFHLYYALLASDGSITTPPMPFHTSPDPGFPRVFVSFTGYGNASWSWLAAGEVDGYAALGTAAGGPPGGEARLPVGYGNHGATPALHGRLTASLDPDLVYLRDTSGIAPAVSGSQVTWDLPDQAFLDAASFLLYVGIPAGAAYGSVYSVGLEFASDGPEANPADNTDSAQVMAARQVFLPLGLRAR